MNKPLYLQIADQLKQQITDGTRPKGSILPTELELQQEFDVSRVTIRKAMKLLVDEELLYRVRGSGTYVSEPKTRHNPFELTGFTEEILAQNKTPATRLISFELSTADPVVAGKLHINEGDEVYSVRRLRLIDEEPEVLEHTFMPVSLFPDLTIEIMRTSKYDYIEKKLGLRIELSRESAMPEIADSDLAGLLNIPQGQPILKVEAAGELENGIPFEFSINRYRVNQYSFDYIARRGKD